jgi:hypothetical protein
MEKLFDRGLESFGLVRVTQDVCGEIGQTFTRQNLDQQTFETIITFSASSDGGGTALIVDPTGQVEPKLYADEEVIEKIRGEMERRVLNKLGGVAFEIYPKLLGRLPRRSK